MNGIIVYRSKYGSTKQYAAWLHEVTGFTMRSCTRPFGRSLKKADVVIAGGCVRIGKLKIAKWIIKHWPKIRNKKVIVFSTSGFMPDDEIVKGIWQKSLPDEIREHCIFFPLPGRLVFKNLSWVDKLIMHVGSLLANDREIKENLLKGFDHVKKDALEPIIECVKKK